MNGTEQPGAKGQLRPEIFTFAEVSSALDTAFELAAGGRLHIWDSVLAASQTSGRGQLRRHWASPPGNIYATLRLPLSPPFDGGAAAAAMGLLAAEALAALGWQVRIKWPNDLVLISGDTPRKVAGILLEERGGVLLAGIGVNVVSHPPAEALRAEAALEATSLAESGKGGAPAPELWARLVSRMLSAYNNARIFARTWRGRAEALLLWRGRSVTVTDGKTVLQGRLAGLWPSGALRLETEQGAMECTGGSLRPA
ncbi:MAG: biotin--[acetyl-CoA-carboxylase] ligase [Desulfovibrio sp.]|uniref:biotin--[acetyl-CoA-carboxylase] ligase n=1 Tax=Desulfovibrio sp. TaxID=885 RepID=UPI001A6FB66E|nr:biotin--[acetyl-CoA-carboxylase] ligase [Desulfovibrio sp.]MBD5417581.1 biotin--[acetyl-CoA-carboxylase] ligase [Desulfovibrio sp.]